MDRYPSEKTDNQKRRKKSQEEGNNDMDTEELELYHLVKEDLRIKSTVGWQNAVKSLNSALTHINRPEGQAFLDYAFPKIINIMLDQYTSKIGHFEKTCATQCLLVSIPIIVTQLKMGKFNDALPVLVMVFNKKKIFYKEIRNSGVMGPYWNKGTSGAPEVRTQCIDTFCEMQGFHLLLHALEKIMEEAGMSKITSSLLVTELTDNESATLSTVIENESSMDGIEVSGVSNFVQSEDIRILLQALFEFRSSVPGEISTRLCLLIMTYYTKISDTLLKKESTDAVGAVLLIIRRLVDAGSVAPDGVNRLWLSLTQRYIASSSLPLRLFGLEQVNQIVNAATSARPAPPSFLVKHAGTAIVNGKYLLKHDGNCVTYEKHSPQTGQIFTLFSCTMKSGMKWWFISEADKMRPGSDEDIDYYQHQSPYEEYLPPTQNWVPTGKGIAPAPYVIAERAIVDDNSESMSMDTAEHETSIRTDQLDNLLTHWIIENKLIEEMFGDRIHREIVTRSALPIRFLAESGCLEPRLLKTIWFSCIQKDQTLIDEIQALLISILPVLSDSQLLCLMETISQSLESSLEKNEPFPEVTGFLQRLATDGGILFLDRSLQVTTGLLRLLWTIQMSSSISDLRLSRILTEFFQQGLRSDHGGSLRKEFLNECIDGIKRSCYLSQSSSDGSSSERITTARRRTSGSGSLNGGSLMSESEQMDNSGSKSLELLKFLIDSYQSDLADVVESLNKEHGLVSLLFDELAAFVARCADKSYPNYRIAIYHRLDLIYYVHIKSTTLELEIEQIERLWNVLSSPAEREYCLIFFNQAGLRTQNHQQLRNMAGNGLESAEPVMVSSAFNIDVCLYIFNELICQQTEFKTLGIMGYKCFHTYFVGLNPTLASSIKSGGEIKRSEVVGLDALWRIVFESPVEVSELASGELLRVYDRLSSEDDKTGNEGHDNEGVDLDKDQDSGTRDFLRRVFEQLAKVQDTTAESLKLVTQCTNLLNGLTIAADRKNPVLSHGRSGRGAYYTIRVVAQRIPYAGSNQNLHNSSPVTSAHNNESQLQSIRTMNVTVFANQTLLLLRKQLEKLIEHPMTQTKILCGGSTVAGDHKTLTDLQLTETSELRVLLFNANVHRGVQSNGNGNYSPHDRRSSHTGSLKRFNRIVHPGVVISSDTHYFDILFNVLDRVAGHPVHSLLWSFLKRIPSNVELLRKITSIGSSLSLENDGDVLMDQKVEGKSESSEDWTAVLHNVSYHQAIYSLQIMDFLLLPSDAQKLDFARSYRKQFIKSGGFRELLSYLWDGDVHATSFNEGAAVAIRLLKLCMVNESGSEHNDYAYPFAEEILDEKESNDQMPNVELEQFEYERLAGKIAELIVSEFERSKQSKTDITATLDKTSESVATVMDITAPVVNSVASSRILVDAVKTVDFIVSQSRSTADVFLKSSELRAIVADILMKCDSEQVREEWVVSLQTMCAVSSNASAIIFASFVDSLKTIEEFAVPVNQYTRMLRFLAQVDLDSNETSLEDWSIKLAQAVVQRLRNGFSNSFLACHDRSAAVLVGILDFLRDFLIYHVASRGKVASEIVEVVYEECLFTLPTVERKKCPLCISSETRRPAFKLLATAIASSTDTLRELCGRLTKLFTRNDALPFLWLQDSQVERRGYGEYVGLKNQGCSCYMNSFLQQLFMQPIIRQGILSAHVSPRPLPQEPTKADVEANPQALIGCRVAVECAGGRVYEAHVTGYDALSERHTLSFDDGGQISYVLREGRPGNENGRYAILPAELSPTEATLEVLREVQRTFCYLRDSEMRYFNPKALIEASKCLNLEFSVYQQNDASEFCDKLLDRLEIGLKSTPEGPRCLQQALGGKLISQKLPKDCGHRYERDEPFIRLELQIRGKESVEESLSAFVQGELMDGDNKVECELCGTKKAAVRRTCFGDLPNYLILHLKRFDLDYTTFETVKLNNRCSFPMNLNMKPYTKVGIEEQEVEKGLSDVATEDEDENIEGNDASQRETSSAAPSSGPTSDPAYEYRLKGILVHSGVAQGGHYYSFIYDNVTDSWFKYDDEDVKPFDPSQIEAECFGGVQRRSWHGSANPMEMEVFSNALMLFYEKVQPKIIVVNDENEMNDIEVAVMENETPIPCVYENEVWKSNELFLHGSYLFDIEFHEFLREMVQSKYRSHSRDLSSPSPTSSPSATIGAISPPPAPAIASSIDNARDLQTELDIQQTLAQVGTEFVLSVLLHSREKSFIARWIPVLSQKFAKYKQICMDFFTSLATTRRATWLQGILFESPDAVARQSFVHLVTRALTAYQNHIINESKDKQDINVQDVYVLRQFLAAIIDCLDHCSVLQQTHLEECFMLIRNCAEVSPILQKDMKSSVDMIARLIHFFLSDRAPVAVKQAFPNSSTNISTMHATRYVSPDYQYLLEAVVDILGIPRRTTEPLFSENSSQYPHRVTLSEKAEEALTEIFHEFQVDGSMGLEEIKLYLLACSGVLQQSPTVHHAVEQRAYMMLSKYGNITTERIELDGFIMYNTDAATMSSKAVLADLHALGFGEDLKRLTLPLPLASTVLEGVSELSKEALLNDAFFDAALEEDAETVGDLLLRIVIGDRQLSAVLLLSLLRCLNSTETGWKGQSIVDACAAVINHLLSFECEYQAELIEITMIHPECGLIRTAEAREKARLRFVNANHAPLFVYRQIVVIIELYMKVPAVKEWCTQNRDLWGWMYDWLRIESLQPSLGGRLSVFYREHSRLETLHRLGQALEIPYQPEERSYIVEGAGFDDVNGVYTSSPEYHTHDGCLIYTYTCNGVEYTLFRCTMPSKSHRWYISHSANRNHLGTASDIDFYFVLSHVDEESPNEVGWKVWAKNEKAKAPPPTVRLFRSTVGHIENGALAASITTPSTPGQLPSQQRDDEEGEMESADADVDDNDVDVEENEEGDIDGDTAEYEDSEDEIRASNEALQAVRLDPQDSGEQDSQDETDAVDGFM